MPLVRTQKRAALVVAVSLALLTPIPAQASVRAPYRPLPVPIYRPYVPYRPYPSPPPAPDPTPALKAQVASGVDAQLQLGDSTLAALGDAAAANQVELSRIAAGIDSRNEDRSDSVRRLHSQLQLLSVEEDRARQLTQASLAVSLLRSQLGTLRAAVDEMAPTESQVALAGLRTALEGASQLGLQTALDTFRARLGPSPSSVAGTPILDWPIPEAEITQGWGPSDLDGEPPFQGFSHFHMGVDLGAPESTPILAAAEGIVFRAGAATTLGRYGGYGNFVVIAHSGNLETVYGHLDSTLVHVGERIGRGQPIGLEGSTGYSTGPHLHFEVHSGGQVVDPSPLLPAGSPH